MSSISRLYGGIICRERYSMQQCAMHNATIHKTTFFELGVCQFLTASRLVLQMLILL